MKSFKQLFNDLVKLFPFTLFEWTNTSIGNDAYATFLINNNPFTLCKSYYFTNYKKRFNDYCERVIFDIYNNGLLFYL